MAAGRVDVAPQPRQRPGATPPGVVVHGVRAGVAPREVPQPVRWTSGSSSPFRNRSNETSRMRTCWLPVQVSVDSGETKAIRSPGRYTGTHR